MLFSPNATMLLYQKALHSLNVYLRLTIRIMREDYLSGDGENLNAAEKEIEKALRPLTFEDFTGQQKVVDNIKVFVQAAKQRNESLDHVLLHGPPGLGKTTLSFIIANEL